MKKQTEELIANKYKILLYDKLGHGSFGAIFKGKCIDTNEEVAIKIESKKCECPQLKHEARILNTLQGGSKFHHFFNNFRGNTKILFQWRLSS